MDDFITQVTQLLRAELKELVRPQWNLLSYVTKNSNQNHIIELSIWIF